MKNKYRFICLFTISIELFGCSSNFRNNLPLDSNRPVNFYLSQSIALIKKGQYSQARRYLTVELRKNPHDCRFNLLNGLTYHLEGHDNDYEKLKLAQVGYSIAKQNCRYNPWPYYYDALINFSEANYEEAAENFSMASQLTQNPQERRNFTEGLILSSYAARNLPQYEKTIEKFSAHDHQNQLIYKRLKTLSQKEKLPQKITEIKTKTSDTSTSTSSQEKTEPIKQVIVDAIIILNRNIDFESRGLNLLNALTLQFGYSRTQNQFAMKRFPEYESATSGSGSFPEAPFSHVITHTISIPDITYDLNIFNSADEESEILARPALLAEDGKEADYFSGDKLILGLAGEISSSISTFSIGVKMAITPTFLPDGSINLKVKIGRDFILPTIQNRAIQFENVVDTISENVETTVNAHYGETIILGALSEKERANNVDATPGLDRVPVLNYLFKKQQERLQSTSVLILLTPQPYLGFPNKSDGSIHGQTAYMYNTLVDPATNIRSVLADLKGISVYNEREEDFYEVLRFHSMIKHTLNSIMH